MMPDPREDDRPPRAVRVWLPVAFRLSTFGTGVGLLFGGGSTDQVGAGLVLTLAGAGLAARAHGWPPWKSDR